MQNLAPAKTNIKLQDPGLVAYYNLQQGNGEMEWAYSFKPGVQPTCG